MDSNMLKPEEPKGSGCGYFLWTLIGYELVLVLLPIALLGLLVGEFERRADKTSLATGLVTAGIVLVGLVGTLVARKAASLHVDQGLPLHKALGQVFFEFRVALTFLPVVGPMLVEKPAPKPDADGSDRMDELRNLEEESRATDD